MTTATRLSSIITTQNKHRHFGRGLKPWQTSWPPGKFVALSSSLSTITGQILPLDFSGVNPL
jgi:hypothetical protein